MSELRISRFSKNRFKKEEGICPPKGRTSAVVPAMIRLSP